MPNLVGLTSAGVRRTIELVNQRPLVALTAVAAPLRCHALSV
jgi:hypothetical protein